VTAENELNIARIRETDEQLVADPTSNDMTVAVDDVEGFAEDF
jgi:hypothetical protein